MDEPMRTVRANPAKFGGAAARRAARFTWDDTVRKLVIVLIPLKRSRLIKGFERT